MKAVKTETLFGIREAMMKKLLIGFLAAIIPFLILVGSLTAEEDKKPGLETRIFDLMPSNARTIYGLQVISAQEEEPKHARKRYKGPVMALSEPLPQGYPPDDLPRILQYRLEVWAAATGGSFSITRDGKLKATNTPQVLDKLEMILASYTPRKNKYTVRLVVFEKEGYQPGGFAGLAEMGYKKAAAKLEEAGYAKAFDTTASISPDRTGYQAEFEETSYIADYEGLIATFAKQLDPVVKTFVEGRIFRMRLTETVNGLRLHVAQIAADLRKMEKVNIGKCVLEKPSCAISRWQRTFDFSGPSLKVATFFSRGLHQVMFLELLEE